MFIRTVNKSDVTGKNKLENLCKSSPTWNVKWYECNAADKFITKLMSHYNHNACRPIMSAIRTDNASQYVQFFWNAAFICVQSRSEPLGPSSATSERPSKFWCWLIHRHIEAIWFRFLYIKRYGNPEPLDLYEPHNK